MLSASVKKIENKNQVKFAPLLIDYRQNQSEESITIFFKKIHSLLYRVAYSFMENNADAEDVLQISFLKIMTNVDQCKGLDEDDNEAIKAWCLSIVRNVSRMKLRSQKSRHQREVKVSERISSVVIEEKDLLQDGNQKELYKNLNTVLMELPEKYRIPIHLKFIEGMDYKEMAVILTTSAETLRVQTKRGLEKMSLSLKKIGIVVSVLVLSESLGSIPLQAESSNANHILEQCLKKKASTSKPVTKFKKNGYSWALFSTVVLIFVSMGYLLKDTLKVKNNDKSTNQITSTNNNDQSLNQTWDFKEGDQNGTKLIKGSWSYVKNSGGMQIQPDKSVVLRLPIKPGERNFVIELDLGIVVGAPQGFSLSSVISREEIVPVFKTISPKFLTINQPTSYKGKVYFYNNYIFSEIGGSFLFISKMEQRSSDYDVSLILKSFLVKKIKVTEMQTIESKLQKSITELDESKMPSYPSYSFDQLSMEN